MIIEVVLALAFAAPAGPPAGLLLSEGAEVARDGRAAVAAPAGELLYPGDVIRAKEPVKLISCSEKLMSTLPAGETARVEIMAIWADRWQSRTQIGACFLPPVVKGPVGGPKHLGAMMIRSMDAQKPGTRETRIQALPPERRELVLQQLPLLGGEGPEAHIMRGALFQRNLLHWDAREEFEAALRLWPKASWLRVLISAEDDAILRSR